MVKGIFVLGLMLTLKFRNICISPTLLCMSPNRKPERRNDIPVHGLHRYSKNTSFSTDKEEQQRILLIRL